MCMQVRVDGNGLTLKYYEEDVKQDDSVFHKKKCDMHTYTHTPTLTHTHARLHTHLPMHQHTPTRRV